MHQLPVPPKTRAFFLLLCVHKDGAAATESSHVVSRIHGGQLGDVFVRSPHPCAMMAPSGKKRLGQKAGVKVPRGVASSPCEASN